MIIVLQKGTTPQQAEEFGKQLEKNYNIKVNLWEGVQSSVLGLIGDTTSIDIDAINAQSLVANVQRVQEPYKKANRKFHPDNTVITLDNGTKIGDGSLAIMAGPCSIEGEEQICGIAESVKNSGAVILRGGKEAINSNTVIADVMREAIETAGLPADCIQLVKDTTRQSSVELMCLSEYLDVLIPRGGAGLIKAVVENSKVPVIETGVGNCHAYVDKDADLDMAVNIVDNGKTQRPSVCNALETVLVHSSVADKFLPMLKSRLDEHNVELHGCDRAKAILGDCVIPAEEYDWANEYLDYKIAIKVVDSLDDAIEHIRKYSTGHSEVIVTNSYEAQRRFTAQVDSAAVYVNASTRFTDGGEFGMGAEIGISTQKLHARGPMGRTELTSMKYVISGDGQIR